MNKQIINRGKSKNNNSPMENFDQSAPGSDDNLTATVSPQELSAKPLVYNGHLLNDAVIV